MDEKLHAAMEDFIARRVLEHGAEGPDHLLDAYRHFSECAQRLNGTLNREQLALYRDCDNAYSASDGASMHYYYRAGFTDAVLLFTGWRDGEWR